MKTAAGYVLLPSIWYSMNTGRFPCKCSGPSYEKHDNVNKLRLEEIEMIGAIGDSDTAAFAANSGGPLTYFTEYWGSSFSTGTDGSWRTHSTLANLLIGGSRGSAIFPDNERAQCGWLGRLGNESFILELSEQLLV